MGKLWQVKCGLNYKQSHTRGFYTGSLKNKFYVLSNGLINKAHDLDFVPNEYIGIM